MNNKQNNNNQGFRLISYESLEPGEGDEVIFFKNVNGYDNLPYLYLAIKKNKNEVYYTNLDTEYDVPAFWDYVEEEINLIDTSDIKEYKRLKYNTPWERTKKRILSFQKVTQKQKYIFSNGFQPNINHNNINVNCIVGKNGCGKSTIIEMIVRIINNLAFAFFGTEFRDNGDYHLYYIENIFASLSFSINENMYTIEIKGRIIDIYKNNRLIISRKLDFESDYYYKTSQSFEGLDELAEIIQFTTIVFNYSVYSYTDWDNIELDEQSKDEYYFNWCYKDNQPSNIMLETNWCAHFNIFNTSGYEIPININPRRINNKYIDIKSYRVISTLNILKLCLFYREENGILKYPLRQFIPNKRIIKLDLAYGFGAPLLKGKHYNYAKKWAKTFEIKIKQLDSTTQEYIENKTIKIAKKYYNSQFDSLNEFEKENIVNKIIKDKSHKTEKIRHILIWFKLFSELEIVKRKKEFDLDYDIRISNEIDNEGFREILFMERTIYMDKNGCIYNYDKQSFFKHRNIKITRWRN